jgi:hypothetical protein
MKMMWLACWELGVVVVEVELVFGPTPTPWHPASAISKASPKSRREVFSRDIGSFAHDWNDVFNSVQSELLLTLLFEMSLKNWELPEELEPEKENRCGAYSPASRYDIPSPVRFSKQLAEKCIHGIHVRIVAPNASPFSTKAAMRSKQRL